MRTIILVICFPVALMLLFSCTSDIIDADGPKKETILDNGQSFLQPLFIGNYYKYKGFAYIQKSGKDSTFTGTVTIIKDTIINNIRWFTSDSSGKVWQTNKKDGFYELTITSDNKYKESFTCKYPAKVGDTFTTHSDTTIVWTVKSLDTTINVAAGSFRCIYYNGILPGAPEFYLKRFYCPGIGFIKEQADWYLIRTSPVANIELVDFKIRLKND